MIVVNVFGAPGDGKSTTAAALFSLLKQTGVNAELVTEVAKDWTWDQTSRPLRWQPMVFGSQTYRVERLADQVDVAVTDGPALLSLLYAPPDTPECFRELVRWAAARHHPINFRVRRPTTRKYQQAGRWQTVEQSSQIGRDLDALLAAENVKVTDLVSDGSAPVVAFAAVTAHLQQKNTEQARVN